MIEIDSWHSKACGALLETDPVVKQTLVADLFSGTLPLMQQAKAALGDFQPLTVEFAGQPDKPELVAPKNVPRRSLASGPGKAAFIHSIAHIEFNAINLALDAVCRFPNMPNQFYCDWLAVAADEARHFGLLTKRLAELGFSYGDFTAHNGLWEMAQKTDGDVLARMALVPRVLEARGLDVTPGMIKKLRKFGDEQSIALLDVILEEEIGHVAIGSHWFRYCCEQQNKPPEATFRELLHTLMRGRVKPPFNGPARLAAGFTENELAELERL